MSTTDPDTDELRKKVLRGRVTDEYLESVESERETTTESDTAEALSAFDAETLDSVSAMESEIETLETKLDLLSASLPAWRVDEVENQLEALSAAIDAHSTIRPNTVEALAARIEGGRR